MDDLTNDPMGGSGDRLSETLSGRLSPDDGIHVTHVTLWDETVGRGPLAVFAHGILTWGDDEYYGFAAQRPLADRHRLLLMDRRGYGRPDIAQSDYETDADDIIRLLDDDGHLVGHAYGGVSALVAAARRPDLVRSLTLIQPGALRPAAGPPVVAAALERARAGYVGTARRLVAGGLSAGLHRGAGDGRAGTDPTAAARRRLLDGRTPLLGRREHAGATGGRALAEAADLGGLGGGARALYKEYAGEPLVACAEFLAEELGADPLVVPGYYPHTQQPEAVNAALRELWAWR